MEENKRLALRVTTSMAITTNRFMQREPRWPTAAMLNYISSLSLEVMFSYVFSASEGSRSVDYLKPLWSLVFSNPGRYEENRYDVRFKGNFFCRMSSRDRKKVYRDIIRKQQPSTFKHVKVLTVIRSLSPSFVSVYSAFKVSESEGDCLRSSQL